MFTCLCTHHRAASARKTGWDESAARRLHARALVSQTAQLLLLPWTQRVVRPHAAQPCELTPGIIEKLYTPCSACGKSYHDQSISDSADSLTSGWAMVGPTPNDDRPHALR